MKTQTSKALIRNIKCCLQNIRQLGKSLAKVGKKTTPDILGFYGELIAWKKLVEKNPKTLLLTPYPYIS